MKKLLSKKKGPKISLNIGASSILVVFILLCLVTFATLSLVSANADYRLSKNIADRTAAYYEATATAQETLAREALEEHSTPTDLDFSVPVSDTQSLHVRAQLQPDHSFEIRSWVIESTGTWTPDNSVTVISE